MIATAHIATLAGLSDIAELPTTDGTIALLTLEAQIDGLEPESRVGLVELISLRGLFLGRVADYERADEIAEQLVRGAATDGVAFAARARTRAVCVGLKALSGTEQSIPEPDEVALVEWK